MMIIIIIIITLLLLLSSSSGRSGLVVARLPAAREGPGSNRAADKSLFSQKSLHAIRSFGHGLHTYCSDQVDLAFHPPGDGK